ncbi:MAG: site-specific tyrosine recombinase XerD [Fermentimonas sp.]|jgi:integrase/recombinase XerD
MPEENKKIIDKYGRYLLLEKGLSKNSIDAYMRDLKKLDSFISEKELSFKEVGSSDLEEFLASLYDSGITASSVARTLSGLRSFFRFMMLDDIRSDDPSELIESPRVPQRLPSVLSIDEIDSILRAIDLSTAEGTRNYAIIETLYSCGLRVSELINLKFSNLYFDEGFIRVEGKRNKQRLVPISEEAIRRIKDWLIYRNQMDVKKGSEDIIFITKRGSKISRSMIFVFVKEYAEAAGIKKDVSPHIFRHSFATHLLERGANIRVIQEMLGHEKIKTTEIYTYLDRDYLRQEVVEYHPRNNHHNNR